MHLWSEDRLRWPMIYIAKAGRTLTISRRETHLSTCIDCVRLDATGTDIVSSASATGFYWELEGKWYLVSNLHCFAGWNYELNRSMSSMSLSPTHVRISLALKTSMEDESDRSAIKFDRRLAALTVDDEPAWLIHPEYGTSVDVAVLPLFDTPTKEAIEEIGGADIFSMAVNTFDDWVRFSPAAGDDIYVLGFPFGDKMGSFPIWKRGSIATEPDIDVEGLPKILVDTATREGMSGSPVIVARKGFTAPNGVFDSDAVIGDAHSFLGVYSGRIGNELEGLQLGVVWKGHVINEIIKGGQRGSWPWNPN